ncbi:MAG TPA: DUF1552 domain-containing protein [Polyangiaceae bacterium]|nr:DUF1552 domain-containing protein [Polyangiaceae bacterium]
MPTNPRVLRASRRVERRIFLKAIALGLSLPAAARLARVALAGPTAAPKRFFVFFMPHGVAPEHYNPQVSASDSTSFALDMTNVSILGPLEPYKAYVNVYSGFQYVGAAQTHAGIVNCLSGITAVDTTTSRTSVEHVIAKALGVQPLILGACSHQPYGLDNNGMLFWDGTPVDPQKNPAAAADALFGGASAAPAPTVDPNVQLRKDLLALTASEIQTLQTELTGLTSEQTKLQTHLASIQSLQSGASSMGSGQAGCTARPSMPTVEMVRAASAGQVINSSGGNDYFYQATNFPLLLQAQLELVTQAIICNAAQVIGLMPMYATSDFDFTFAGAPGSHHSTLSHTTPSELPTAQYNSPNSISNYDPNARAAFATAQRWFTQQLVTKVVSILATTDDPAAPGTKVLDNTLIYWMSEIGDGAEHTRVSELERLGPAAMPSFLPLVTIGKCGGAIKSGQVVQYAIGDPNVTASAPTTVNRPATDLYLTFAQAMGATGVTFPGTTGPVTEVLGT